MHGVVLEQQIHNWIFLTIRCVLANHFALEIVLAPFSFDISSFPAHLFFSDVTTSPEARSWESPEVVIIQFIINFIYPDQALVKNQKSVVRT